MLTKEENVIQQEFINLLNLVGYKQNVSFNKNIIEDRVIYIYKDKQIWKSSMNNNGEYFESKDYNSLYDLCIDIILHFDKDVSDFLLDQFPSIIEKRFNEDKTLNSIFKPKIKTKSQ